jgi:SAM-dependent methyltransferase
MADTYSRQAGQSAIYSDGTYLRNNPSWHAQDSAWKAGQIAAVLTRNALRPKTVAEIGCGAGQILVELASKMPETRFTGYEISPQAYVFCSAKTSRTVAFLQRNLFEEDSRYDCLLCIDVFEHVPDYMGFLKSLRDKADTKIFHIPLDLTAAALMRGKLMHVRETAGHLHYFTRETALATLSDCGYTIVDEFYTTAFMGIPPTTLLSRLAWLPRRVLYALAPQFMQRLIGGCSLMVLAR